MKVGAVMHSLLTSIFEGLLVEKGIRYEEACQRETERGHHSNAAHQDQKISTKQSRK